MEVKIEEQDEDNTFSNTDTNGNIIINAFILTKGTM